MLCTIAICRTPPPAHTETHTPSGIPFLMSAQNSATISPKTDILIRRLLFTVSPIFKTYFAEVFLHTGNRRKGRTDTRDGLTANGVGPSRLSGVLSGALRGGIGIAIEALVRTGVVLTDILAGYATTGFALTAVFL